MLEARQLVPQSDVLGDEVGSVFEDGDDDREDQRQLERHPEHDSRGGAEAENDELHPRSE